MCVVWCGVVWLCGVTVSFVMVRDLAVWCCDDGQVGVWCRGVCDGTRRGDVVL